MLSAGEEANRRDNVEVYIRARRRIGMGRYESQDRPDPLYLSAMALRHI